MLRGMHGSPIARRPPAAGEAKLADPGYKVEIIVIAAVAKP
jgi:hypothetical protein